MSNRSSNNLIVRTLVSMGSVAALVVFAWLVLGFFGFHFALVSSLVISLIATAVMSLGSQAMQRLSS